MLRSRLTCSVALMSALLGFAPAGTRSAEEEVIKIISAEQIRSLLTGMGLEFRQIDDRTFRFELDGFKVFLFHTESDCQLYSGFKDDCDAPKINSWNRTKRFSRAYLDGEGDPCLEADLDFEGGVTRESFREFVKTFRISVRSFAKYVRG